MTLIKSVSGIRGTIGGFSGENLTPFDILKFTSAYVMFMQKRIGKKDLKIVVGRDARISGEMVRDLVLGTLSGMGTQTIDIGMATTPTTEIAVTEEKADGGIIITASHNPRQWNALKLLNEKGEFLSAKDGQELLEISKNFENFEFATIDSVKKNISKTDYLQKHIDLILKDSLVDVEAIKKAEFTVALDAVNSIGGPAITQLLKQLGVKKIVGIYCDPTGEFPHNPEPLPENLVELSKLVIENKANVGFAVDPDVDRLAIINEDGTMFGEEYTLVAVSDYILSNKQGNTVSNLSSSRALKDVTIKYGGKYTASAVGEINVVEEMKRVNAVIGGEGNGGIIYPPIHYGRDSLIGVALFLTYLAKKKKKCSEIRAEFPNYIISKNKIELKPEINVDLVLDKIYKKFSTYPNVQISIIDGVKIDFPEGWVHLRKSNTEPIIRIYAESYSVQKSEELAQLIINSI